MRPASGTHGLMCHRKRARRQEHDWAPALILWARALLCTRSEPFISFFLFNHFSSLSLAGLATLIHNSETQIHAAVSRRSVRYFSDYAEF